MPTQEEINAKAAEVNALWQSLNKKSKIKFLSTLQAAVIAQDTVTNFSSTDVLNKWDSLNPERKMRLERILVNRATLTPEEAAAAYDSASLEVQKIIKERLTN